MHNLKSKLNKEIKWANKVIYILSWFLIIFVAVLIILRYANGRNSFWPNVDYFLLFFVVLDLIILNRLTSKKEIENEKFVFGLICGFFVLDLLWMVDIIMNKTTPVLEERVFLPYRLNYIVLILGLILLSLNKGPLGVWFKSWLLKFKDPRAFIVLALVFLILCPFLLTFKQEAVAEKAANMAYFLLVIGVFGQFVQYIRQNKKEKINLK